MAAKNIKGITVEIGGNTTKLDKALASSNSQSKALQNELKEVNKMLKFDPSNVDLLTQKQKILSEQIAATSERLDILKAAEAQVQAQFERGDIGADQYRAFQRELMTTEGQLEGLQNALNSTNQTLEHMADGTTESKTELEKLSDTIKSQEKELADLKNEYANIVLEQGATSEEAQELAARITELNSDLQANSDKLQDARSEADKLTESLDDTGEAADDSGGGFTVMKGALADLVSNAIQGAISAVGDLIGSLLELSEATEEYRTMQAKLEGSAESFGYSLDFANEKYKQFYEYVGDDQMATNAITNLLGMQVSTETVSEAANAAIAVWSAYGDSIPIEGLTESINETAQVAKVTGSLADALNWAGISEDAFNAKLETMSSTQERADYIARALNSTYGASKKTYDDLSGSLRDANAAEVELKDTQAELGQAIEPVNTAITEMKNKALEAILPIVVTLSGAFSDLYGWMKRHPAVAQAVTVAVIALATAFGVLAGALAIQALIQGVTKAIKGLNLALTVNPIMLVVAAISALVAGFVYLWNTSEDFRNFWIGLWDSIVSVASAAKDKIVQFFTQTIPNAFKNLVSSVQSLFSGLAKNILSALDQLFPGFSTVINNIFSAFKNRDWGSLGKYLVQGIANGILAAVTLPIRAIKYVAQSVWNTFARALSIHSPSKVMEDGGEYIDQGLADGINKNAGTVKKAAKDLAEAVEKSLQINKSKLDRMLDGITTAIKKQLEEQKKAKLKSIEDDLSAEEKASEKRLKIYEDEYNQKTKRLDAETNAQTKALQDQIDALDKAEEAREKAQEEAEYNSTIANLNDKLLTAETAEEKADIQREIDQTIADWNEKKRKEEIEAQKEALKAQIEEIEKNADSQKEILDKQYNERVTAENNRLEAVKASAEEERDYWEEYYSERLSEESVNAAARKLILDKNQDEIVSLLETYNPKWQDAGQSLADSLIYGLESERQSTRDAIAESIDLTDVIAQQETQLESLKAAAESAGSSGGKVEEAFEDLEFPAGEAGEFADALARDAEEAGNSGTMLGALKDKILGIGDNLKTWFSENWQGLLSFITTPFVNGFNFVSTKFEEFKLGVDNLVTTVKQKFSDWVNAIVTFFTVDIPAGIDGFVNFLGSLPEKIGYWLGYALGTIARWGVDLVTWATTNIPLFIESVIQFFATLPGRVQEWLTNTLNNIIAWGVNMVNTGRQKASEFINAVISFIQQLPGKIKQWLDQAVEKVIQWATDLIREGKKAASDTVDAVVKAFEDLPGKIKDVGSDLVHGLWEGITSAGDWLKRKIKNFADNIIDGFKDAFDINSPSRVMRDAVGKFLPAGIGEGITDNADSALEAVDSLSDDLIERTQGINGLTLNRRLETTFKASTPQVAPVTELVRLVSEYFPKLIEASKHAIVLDSGTLVGETISQIDERLAHNYTLKARGI